MADKRTIPPELLDRLLDGTDPRRVFDSDGLIADLKKALAERILDAEMDVHLGSEEEQAAGNHRNGHSKKTVLTDSSALGLSIPRDRHGHFEPQLIEKYRRRFPGFDEKIIALYARCVSRLKKARARTDSHSIRDARSHTARMARGCGRRLSERGASLMTRVLIPVRGI